MALLQQTKASTASGGFDTLYHMGHGVTAARSDVDIETAHWSPTARWASSSVETISLRKGFDLVLSKTKGDGCSFHFQEPSDVFGIGFHLEGGAAFDMEGEKFRTRPLDVWAGGASRGTSSVFRLPESGFRTASLRFAPDTFRELLGKYDQSGNLLDEMARLATSRVTISRLAPLDASAAQIVERMFAAPYTGAARTMYLESCALGLLAAQIDAVTRTERRSRNLANERHMHDARVRLDENLENPPSIIELARLLGINDFKLKRSFKETFGITIFGYVRQRRMERAADSLHAGLSVADTAAAAGYVCPRCFADAFRRHFGKLPSEVTRAALENAPGSSG